MGGPQTHTRSRSWQLQGGRAAVGWRVRGVCVKLRIWRSAPRPPAPAASGTTVYSLPSLLAAAAAVAALTGPAISVCGLRSEYWSCGSPSGCCPVPRAALPGLAHCLRCYHISRLGWPRRLLAAAVVAQCPERRTQFKPPTVMACLLGCGALETAHAHAFQRSSTQPSLPADPRCKSEQVGPASRKQLLKLGVCWLLVGPAPAPCFLPGSGRAKARVGQVLARGRARLPPPAKFDCESGGGKGRARAMHCRSCVSLTRIKGRRPLCLPSAPSCSC